MSQPLPLNAPRLGKRDRCILWNVKYFPVCSQRPSYYPGVVRETLESLQQEADHR